MNVDERRRLLSVRTALLDAQDELVTASDELRYVQSISDGMKSKIYDRVEKLLDEISSINCRYF